MPLVMSSLAVAEAANRARAMMDLEDMVMACAAVCACQDRRRRASRLRRECGASRATTTVERFFAQPPRGKNGALRVGRKREYDATPRFTVVI